MLKFLQDKLSLPYGTFRAEVVKKMIARSSGVFLWVELVTKNVNYEVRQGNIHKILDTLERIPQDLDALIRSMLHKRSPQDSSKDVRLIVCMQLILHSTRALTLEETYWALITHSQPSLIKDWNQDIITKEVMERFVVSSSRGLVALVQPKRMERTEIQFIHESVPETLRSEAEPGGLCDQSHEKIDQALFFNACSHQFLKSLCQTYLEHCRIAEYLETIWTIDFERKHQSFDFRHEDCREVIRSVVTVRFPFLTYAVDNVFTHYAKARCVIQGGKDRVKADLHPDVSMLHFPLLSWLWPYTIVSDGERMMLRHFKGVSIYTLLFYALLGTSEPESTPHYSRSWERQPHFLSALLDLADTTARKVFADQRNRSLRMFDPVHDADLKEVERLVRSEGDTASHRPNKTARDIKGLSCSWPRSLQGFLAFTLPGLDPEITFYERRLINTFTIKGSFSIGKLDAKNEEILDSSPKSDVVLTIYLERMEHWFTCKGVNGHYNRLRRAGKGEFFHSYLSCPFDRYGYSEHDPWLLYLEEQPLAREWRYGQAHKCAYLINVLWTFISGS